MSDINTLHVYIVAGEPSGDVLGGKLMRALKAHNTHQIQFSGVGGKHMQEQGLTSLFPMEELSLIGFAEIIPHIPKLLWRIHQTAMDIITKKPDIVVTIDSPGFNFRLAKKLQTAGIPLVHYVAPTVWAYRPKRAAHIAKLYNHLLTLLPFEPHYFEKEGLSTTFTGHPLIEDLAIANDNAPDFRNFYDLPKDQKILCMMPGSRQGEIERLFPVFLEAIRIVAEKNNHNFSVVIPTLSCFSDMIEKEASTLPVHVIVTSRDQDKMAAFKSADLALVKSGTGALELALYKVPMVVGYIVKPLSAWLMRKMIQVPFVNLVNLLQGKEVIPECLQENCTAERLAEELDVLLNSEEARIKQQAEFDEALRKIGSGQALSPSQTAANAVLALAQANQPS